MYCMKNDDIFLLLLLFFTYNIRLIITDKSTRRLAEQSKNQQHGKWDSTMFDERIKSKYQCVICYWSCMIIAVNS